MPKLRLLGALAVALAVGCGRPPQISRPNQTFIDALRTATSSRMLPWVEECAKSLEARKQQGGISAEESKAFEEIIALARAEKWTEARDAAKRLGKGQRLSVAKEQLKR